MESREYQSQERWMRAYVIAAVLSVSLVLSMPDISWASATTGTWTSDSGIGSSVETNVNTGSESHSGETVTCVYSEQTGENASDIEYFVREGTLTKGDGPGAWYVRACFDANGIEVSDNFIWIATANPTALAQQALQYTSLPKPSIKLNPAIERDQIVNVPTWLWVDSAWNPVSAQASAGGITVSTTATPVQITWNTGDGQTRICNGPGTAYNTNRPDDQQRTDCSHTYTYASTDQPSGRFTVTATQVWHVTWTATGVPAGTPAAGDLGTITNTASTSVRVVEVQALNQAR